LISPHFFCIVFQKNHPEIVSVYQISRRRNFSWRQLSHDDLTHYQQVVVAVQKTIEWMEKIDNAIPKWPVE